MGFQQRILAAFAVAVLAVVVLVAVAARTTLGLIDQSELASAATYRQVLVKELQRKLFEAESVVRAYAFTGYPAYLDEFEASDVDIRTLLNEVDTIAFDLEVQTGRATHLTQLAGERLELMRDLARVRQEAGEDAAREVVNSGRGKRIMDRVREVSAEFDTTQQVFVAEVHREQQRAARSMLNMLIGLALLVLIVLVSCFEFMRREWARGGGYVARLRDTAREMALLGNLSNGLQSCGSVDEGRDLLRHFLDQLFPLSTGALYILRSSRNLLEVKASWGGEVELAPHMEPQDCWGLRLGRAQIFRPGGDNLPCVHAGQAEAAYLCVPMMAEGEALGVLHLRLGIAGKDETAVATEKAERIATQIGPVVASLILREQFRLQSIRDGLTGLYNRRYLEETMGRELQRAARSNSGLAVIMADVDHFKKLNDTHGHQAGDDALQQFAQYLRDGVRGDDIACRYGGEEFAVILPGATLEQAQQRAEKLRSGVANLRVRTAGQTLPPLSASFGVAAFPQHGDSWEALLRAADGALYQAKREGRNRVVLAALN